MLLEFAEQNGDFIGSLIIFLFLIDHLGRDGVILACDVPGLVTLAKRADCVIRMVPQVGDFVAAGDPLFKIEPGGTRLPTDALRQSVCVGDERTLEQDPTFVFRILVGESRYLLCRELTLLHRSAERCFTEPEDRALAEVSGLQGMAGSQRHAKADKRVIEKTHP